MFLQFCQPQPKGLQLQGTVRQDEKDIRRGQGLLVAVMLPLSPGGARGTQEPMWSESNAHGASLMLAFLITKEVANI